MNIFLQGLTMGLAYVAPIGMQNLFVINSALTNKRKRALLTALIVIFFDITLSLACFFGIGTIMQKFKWLQMVILCVGSLIVIYRHQPAACKDTGSGKGSAYHVHQKNHLIRLCRNLV